MTEWIKKAIWSELSTILFLIYSDEIGVHMIPETQMFPKTKFQYLVMLTLTFKGTDQKAIPCVLYRFS